MTIESFPKLKEFTQQPNMQILFLEETDSTNNWIANHENDLQSPCLVWCRRQTAGRGQRGNSWESAPGMNFTGSWLIRPINFPASSQFHLSEAVALAVVYTLSEYGIRAMVKWPNDIYVDNLKICGILIEHAVTGKDITRSIAGIGVNINQIDFISDAPNPVSMKMITGKNFRVEKFAEKLAFYLDFFTNRLIKEPEFLHKIFMNRLWRNDEQNHPFLDKLTGKPVSAKISGVYDDGRLQLTTSAGEERTYAFKEIEFLLR